MVEHQVFTIGQYVTNRGLDDSIMIGIATDQFNVGFETDASMTPYGYVYYVHDGSKWSNGVRFLFSSNAKQFFCRNIRYF